MLMNTENFPTWEGFYYDHKLGIPNISPIASDGMVF